MVPQTNHRRHVWARSLCLWQAATASDPARLESHLVPRIQDPSVARLRYSPALRAIHIEYHDTNHTTRGDQREL
jgi:hypothetical protein